MNTILIYPLVWIPLVGILLALLAGFGAFKARGRMKRAAFATIAAACVLLPGYLLVAVFAPQWIDVRYRVYKALYDDIESGMTRDQVLAAVDTIRRAARASAPRS